MEHKIIFLDIDGVLNTSISIFANLTQKIWDKSTCNLLINICKFNPNVKIVVSSMWRSLGKDVVLQHFVNNGFDLQFFHDDWKTPFMHGIDRGYEIQDWLDNHPSIKNYVILDDDWDMLPKQKKHFIKIHVDDGITYSQYLYLCQKLNVKSSYIDENRMGIQ